jgi:AraC-like DNA-binding protein
MDLETIMPSLVHDAKYYIGLQVICALPRPGDALALAKMNTDSDITQILTSIQVPTLILHRANYLGVNVEEGKYLAKYIPSSKFAELKGDDHCFWVGNSFSVNEEIEEFVTGRRSSRDEGLYIKTRTSYTRINIEKMMIDNFQYNLGIEEFAVSCGRILSVFKRDFNKKFKTTPYKWLKSKRLKYAQTLLLESNMNVNQICYESGFNNYSHFIKSFREKFNSSPKQCQSNHLVP